MCAASPEDMKANSTAVSVVVPSGGNKTLDCHGHKLRSELPGSRWEWRVNGAAINETNYTMIFIIPHYFDTYYSCHLVDENHGIDL